MPDCTQYELKSYSNIEELMATEWSIVLTATDDASQDTVVVKYPRNESAQRFICSEAILMGPLSHPHVLKLLGVLQTTPNTPSLVLEYAPESTLRSYLAARSYEADVIRCDNTVLIPMVHGLLEGITYLHGENILHRDLKLDNILLGKDRCIKIADFGLAVKVKDKSLGITTTELSGTHRWMAPELFVRFPTYTDKSDMWAVALVMWCMFHLEDVHAAWSHAYLACEGRAANLVDLVRHIKTGPYALPDKITDECVKSLYLNLMNKNPEKRMSAQEALTLFKKSPIIDEFHDCSDAGFDALLEKIPEAEKLPCRKLTAG